MNNIIWSASALLPDGWAESVEISIDESGTIEQVDCGVPYTRGERYGLLIAGIPNVHSHAHQRAMAGLGEQAGQAVGSQTKDSFWTWRKVMYRMLERIQPDHLYNLSAQLYLEMLKSGYTSVGEFQYLHHDIAGQPYQNPAEMTLQCMNAAAEVGIGFTALPVLYRYGGFGSTPSDTGQKRFINDAEAFNRIVEILQKESQKNPDTAVGIAPHSLRAVDQQLLSEVLETSGADQRAAVHIHIAEQTKEVDDCLAWCRQRPVEWLLNHFDINSQWCLVHATHMTSTETLALAESGAVAGLCPTTEANLGDGFFNAGAYMEAGGRWAIGSDSHISISPVEELRWLEYGQRLSTHSRNVLVSNQQAHTGRNLLDSVLQGGAQACGRRIGRIENGHRADLIVLDERHPRLYGRKHDDLLDSWIFSGNENPVKTVFVGGRKVINDRHHVDEEKIIENFRKTLDQLNV